MNELTVIYRAYGGETIPPFKKERPVWFNKKKCWKSFYDSFGGKCKIHLVWDGDENELSEYVSKFVALNKVNYKGNQESLSYCYDLMASVETPFCANIEDDYLWLPGSYEFLMDALKLGYDPITLFDHPDRYSLGTNNWYTGGTDITQGRDYIGVTNYGYVRTCESTTASFASSKNFILMYKEMFHHYNNIGNGAPEDRKLWRHLSQLNVRLWSSIGGLCTHVSLPLAPHGDWEGFNNQMVL